MKNYQVCLLFIPALSGCSESQEEIERRRITKESYRDYTATRMTYETEESPPGAVESYATATVEPWYWPVQVNNTTVTTITTIHYERCDPFFWHYRPVYFYAPYPYSAWRYVPARRVAPPIPCRPVAIVAPHRTAWREPSNPTYRWPAYARNAARPIDNPGRPRVDRTPEAGATKTSRFTPPTSETALTTMASAPRAPFAGNTTRPRHLPEKLPEKPVQGTAPHNRPVDPAPNRPVAPPPDKPRGRVEVRPLRETQPVRHETPAPRPESPAPRQVQSDTRERVHRETPPAPRTPEAPARISRPEPVRESRPMEEPRRAPRTESPAPARPTPPVNRPTPPAPSPPPAPAKPPTERKPASEKSQDKKDSDRRGKSPSGR